MINYLKPEIDSLINEMSVLGLAYIGDAVFELMVRTWLCSLGKVTAKKLHSEAVKYVSAKAQSAAIEKLLPHLNEDEYSIYKRGRNTHVTNIPRGSSIEEYHDATGFEALMGYLYLSGKTERLGELFELVT